MNQVFITRPVARGLLRSATPPQRHAGPALWRRTFASEPPLGGQPPPSSTRSRDAGTSSSTGASSNSVGGSIGGSSRTSARSSMQQLTGLLNPDSKKTSTTAHIDDYMLDRMDDRSLSGSQRSAPMQDPAEPYHFHIYSHKHNTHVTVTRPNREPIISMSCGNLGIRGAPRKNYDAAYQLGAFVIDKLQQAGWHNKIHALEVVLRGFGPGREAVTKVLLGNEGRMLRPKIERVTDSTRLKFGGTRSQKPKRLG